MTDLPPGWAWATFGDVAALSLGKMLDKKQATGLHRTPYLRNINVRWGDFDLRDVARMDIRPEELARVQAISGDLVVCEGGEPGRAAVWRGPEPIALQKALHRVRPASGISAYYLAYYIESLAATRRLESSLTGTTIKHLPKERLADVVIPLPPSAEQARIVAAIDEHSGRLELAQASVANLRAALNKFDRAVLASAQVEGSEGELGRLLLRIETGRSFSTSGRPATPDEWGVIKVSAMTWGQFDDNQHKAVPLSQKIDPRYEIKSGDLLLSRANTSEYVGAAVLVRRTRPRLLLSDKSMRLVTIDGVDRQWLRYALGSPQLRSQMSSLATGTSDSMRNISQDKVRSLRMRVPCLERQKELATRIEAATVARLRLVREMETARRKAFVLRKGVLAAAFSGQLVPQDSADEPASVLLDRIRAERSSAPAPRRRKATS